MLRLLLQLMLTVISHLISLDVAGMMYLFIHSFREQLAKVLEAEEDFTRAAQTLAGIDLDSGERLGFRSGVQPRLLHVGCEGLGFRVKAALLAL